MEHLPRDTRGYPVPFIVLRDRMGLPVFTANDTRRVRQTISARLCGICGKELLADTWLLGGPQSAFHFLGVYIDPPMHRECGTYALQVCPHLAISTHRVAPPERVARMEKKLGGGALVIDPTVDPARVPYFVFVRVLDWQINPRGYVVPVKPYLTTEYWLNGRQISKEEARKL